MRIAGAAVGADEADRDASSSRATSSEISSRSEPDRAAALALHRAAVHLAGDLPLAFAEHVIDRGADRREPPRDLAFRQRAPKIPSEIPRR